jgi:acyl carrier protein
MDQGIHMSDAIYVRVENIFRDILTDQQFETLHPTATMDDVDGWDSMSFLEIIMALESEFNIDIDVLDAAKLVSIPNILDYLRSKS